MTAFLDAYIDTLDEDIALRRASGEDNGMQCMYETIGCLWPAADLICWRHVSVTGKEQVACWVL